MRLNLLWPNQLLCDSCISLGALFFLVPGIQGKGGGNFSLDVKLLVSNLAGYLCLTSLRCILTADTLRKILLMAALRTTCI